MNQVDMIDEWVAGVPDSLTLKCGVCGQVPRFDYHVNSDVWNELISEEMKRGVVCLPCFNKMAKNKGINLANCLVDIHFCDGLGETIHLVPVCSYTYPPRVIQ